MRLIDTLLINRIPCARDLKCDVKEHALEFSTFVMNSQHSSMIACMPSLVFTKKCQSDFLLPKFFCLLLFLLLFLFLMIMLLFWFLR